MGHFAVNVSKNGREGGVRPVKHAVHLRVETGPTDPRSTRGEEVEYAGRFGIKFYVLLANWTFSGQLTYFSKTRHLNNYFHGFNPYHLRIRITHKEVCCINLFVVDCVRLEGV